MPQRDKIPRYAVLHPGYEIIATKQNGRLFAGRFKISKSKPDQTAAVIHCCSFAFGAAPT